MKLINRSQLLIFCSDGGAAGGGSALDNETKPPFQFPLSAYAGEILNRTHSKPSKNHSTKNLSATTSPPRNSYTDKTVNKSPKKHLDREGLFKTSRFLFLEIHFPLATKFYLLVFVTLNGPEVSDKQKTIPPEYK